MYSYTVDVKECKIKALEMVLINEYKTYWSTKIKTEGVTDDMIKLLDVDKRELDKLHECVQFNKDFKQNKIDKENAQVWLVTLNLKDPIDPKRLEKFVERVFKLKLFHNPEACIETTIEAFPRWHLHIATNYNRNKGDLLSRVNAQVARSFRDLVFNVDVSRNQNAYKYVNGDKKDEKLEDVQFSDEKRKIFQIKNIYTK